MLSLKRQQFRAKQRQLALNELFNKKRLPCFSQLTQIENIIQNKLYDSHSFQESIDMLLNLSQNTNLSSLYKTLLNIFVDIKDYQIDVGYYVLGLKILLVLLNQLEMSHQPQLINLIKEIGLQNILNFQNSIILQFLELYLIQVEVLSIEESKIIYDQLLVWSESMQYNFHSFLICFNLLLNFNPDLLTPSLSMQIIAVLMNPDSNGKELVLDLLQKSNWKQFSEEQLIIVWDVLCQQLLLFENEEICLKILNQITYFFFPFKIQEITSYLSQTNNCQTEKVLEVISNMRLNRNYDQLTEQLLDQFCIKIHFSPHYLKYLIEFLKNNSLLQVYNFPNEIQSKLFQLN